MKRFFDINIKKALDILLIILISGSMFCGCTDLKLSSSMNKNNKEMRVLDYNEVKNSLIRFHVIANSDNDEDQQLKLKVKNKVIEYLYPYLNKSESLENSRNILNDKMEDVKTIAENVIKEEGYDYSVNIQLSRENFPDKSYGNIVLPQGNYEAFRILIGNAEGKNWWCVMFPPLCFVDESKAEVEYDKVEENIKNKQNKNEENLEESSDNVQVKFKIVEVIQDLLK
ncbi:stage II sporulation protein R [uncultured Clostridium sp.]|uniref:stage II sporulation protein R n=1 Tax=uncultured Clostridium sp. TaxID=59620 RepID=UPI0025FC6068|nr:stage II sporulation protein R [uncultured Clostridium sp.]